MYKNILVNEYKTNYVIHKSEHKKSQQNFDLLSYQKAKTQNTFMYVLSMILDSYAEMLCLLHLIRLHKNHHGDRTIISCKNVSKLSK